MVFLLLHLCMDQIRRVESCLVHIQLATNTSCRGICVNVVEVLRVAVAVVVVVVVVVGVVMTVRRVTNWRLWMGTVLTLMTLMVCTWMMLMVRT